MNLITLHLLGWGARSRRRRRLSLTSRLQSRQIDNFLKHKMVIRGATLLRTLKLKLNSTFAIKLKCARESWDREGSDG